MPVGPAGGGRHLRDLEEGPKRGLRFDRAAAQHAIDFFGFLHHSKGEWAGQPFQLEPWQQFIQWVVYGWKRRDGLRRFRTAYIEVPRKNGKTTFMAGNALYLMVADGEPGAEIYSAAVKREQAKLCWSEAVRMVQASPALGRMVRHFRASDNLSIEATASKYQPLGADAESMDGLNIHGALIDELHAHRTPAIVEVLQTATGARRQPLVWEITTAGSDRESICRVHHEYSEQVLKGTVEDDTWFGFIATLDEGDDWADPAVWAKANPNYGVSVKPDDLQRKAEQAKAMPMAQNAFMRLHLDVWTQQTDRGLTCRCAMRTPAVVDEKVLREGSGYGGLDLSSVSISRPADGLPGRWGPERKIVARFWVPEARLHDRENRYREQYQMWARQGWLQVTPGDAVDYATVRKGIMADAERFRIVSLNVDRLFQGYQLSQELADEGLEVFGMGQGFYGMAAPMREFERRLLAKKLEHGGNPVLRWMADNVAVRQDPAGNLKPDKAASQGKIDGIVALVMALDRAMRHEPPKKSVYESRGLVTV